MEDKTKSPLTVLGVVLIVLFVGILIVSAASSSTEDSPLTSVSVSTSSVIPTRNIPSPHVAPVYTLPEYEPMTFNPTIESDRLPFVNACLGNGVEWGRCNCDFDYLISHYGFAWFVESSANIQALGEIPYSQMNLAANYCSQFATD